MHSMDNYYVSKLIPLIAEAGVAAIANPLINITLQGRHDTYPKRRGMTRVPELMAAGVHGRVRPRLRDGPLVLAGLGRHAGGGAHGGACRPDDQPGGDARLLRGGDRRRRRKVMGLEGYGLEPGCRADLVVLEAGDAVEAIRLKAARLFVLRRGPDRWRKARHGWCSSTCPAGRRR